MISASAHLRPTDHLAASHAARLVAAEIRAGHSPCGEPFDLWLPRALSDVSERYWTPLPVLRRAAAWLRETRVRTVVDIGSGAGKFCVATALLAPCRFIGLEQRLSLVESARALAEVFGVADRVTFIKGDFGLTPTPAADAYYLFNPFGDYFFGSERFDEPDPSFTEETYVRDVLAVTRLLSLAPAGTIVITYNGFGGKVPRSYEQIDVDLSFTLALRLWRKRGPASRTSVHRKI